MQELIDHGGSANFLRRWRCLIQDNCVGGAFADDPRGLSPLGEAEHQELALRRRSNSARTIAIFISIFFRIIVM
jgi:hypothetical protein